jgi:ABC-type uncharacterized transport system permease subunit
VGAGGIGVIVALALIFVYLFYETFPMLKPVSVELDRVRIAGRRRIRRRRCT